jgi:hypothetical protein
VPNLLGRLVSRSCAHEFLWPHRDSGGGYYQTCARCGKHFTFDWKAMTRGEKSARPVGPRAPANPTSVRGIVARARRFTVRKPIFYRPTGGAQFKLGVLLDVSRSGVLLECQSQLYGAHPDIPDSREDRGRRKTRHRAAQGGSCPRSSVERVDRHTHGTDK